MGWSSGLIVHCKPCYGNTQLDLADNGINSFLGFSGPTETHHMNLYTSEKPSFLLFGIDCKSPTEAAFKPEATLHVSDYREEMMLF